MPFWRRSSPPSDGQLSLDEAFGGDTATGPLAGALTFFELTPTPANQLALLTELARLVDPLRKEHKLPGYQLAPGFRLRRLWGLCRQPTSGGTAQIQVRCTGDVTHQWRRPGAIVATLLHEMAHLRYHGHGPRFWAFYRGLLDRAARSGLYAAELDDPNEPARGAEKLAGSAADESAQAAKERRRERAQANRLAARGWEPGSRARVTLTRGPLANAEVRVLEIRRSWLLVEHARHGRYRVAARVLEPIAAGALA
jgi:hypothetical protein